MMLPPLILPVVVIVLEPAATAPTKVFAVMTLAPEMLEPEPVPIFKFPPIFALPVTSMLVRVPTEVMFGCAFAVTVPALNAYVAFATVPVTLAPVIEVRAEPLPLTLVKSPLTAPMLPTFALPLAYSVPLMLAPVVVTTNTLALPPAEILTFPSAVGIFTFDVPFARGPMTLPAVILPVTDRLASVPTLVRLELTIVAARVVPVKLAAFAVIAVLAAAVSWP